MASGQILGLLFQIRHSCVFQRGRFPCLSRRWRSSAAFLAASAAAAALLASDWAFDRAVGASGGPGSLWMRAKVRWRSWPGPPCMLVFIIALILGLLEESGLEC